jgi:hypothetical protein
MENIEEHTEWVFQNWFDKISQQLGRLFLLAIVPRSDLHGLPVRVADSQLFY